MKNNYKLINMMNEKSNNPSEWMKRIFTSAGFRTLVLSFLLIISGIIKSNAACTPPSSSAGTPVITCASDPNMTITWTAAGNSSNCNGYVVIRYTGYPANNSFSISDGTALPTQGTTPSLFAGNFNGYIEYVGSGLSVTTTTVAAGTQYYWYVIPYNNGISSCSPSPSYRTSSVAFATNTPNTPPGQVASVTTGTPTPLTIPNISFPPVSGADGYLVCTNPNGYYSSPTDGTTYNIGDTFDNGSGTPWDQTIQYNGSNTSGITASTNLLPNTTYAITIYAYKSNKYPCSGGPLYVYPVSRTTGSARTAFNTGIAESLINTGAVLIYPNPSSEQLSIHSSSLNINETIVVSVLNLTGQIVQTEMIKWSDNNTLDIKALSGDIYFLQLKTSTKCVREKFVKQ